MPIRNSVNPHEATRPAGDGGGGVATGDHDGDEKYGTGRSGSTGERTTSRTVVNPHEATRMDVGGGGVATGDHDGDEKYVAGSNGGSVRSGSARGRTTSRTVVNPHEATQTVVGGGGNNVKTGTVVAVGDGSGGSNVVTGDSTAQQETSGSVPSLQLVSDPQTWARQGYQPYTDVQGVTHVGSAHEGVERRYVGLAADGGSREADAAVQRALQVFRERGATREQLTNAEHHLRGAVGRGQDTQELANIARIRELTRGQLHVWDGSAYRQTDPDAVVTIGIDEAGDIFGSTTSRPKPLSPHEREMQTIEQRIIAENEARRQPDPNDPIGRQVIAFRELQALAGPGGFTGREFSEYVDTGTIPGRLTPEPSAPAQEGMTAGGGYQPADTAGLLSVGGDLAPHVLTPGEARAMGKPELAGYTIETDADGRLFAVPPDSKRAESAIAEWNVDMAALTANPNADDLNVLADKWGNSPDADLISLSVPVYGETDDGYGLIRYEQQTPGEWAASAAAKLTAAPVGEGATTDDAYGGDSKAPETPPAGYGADLELTGFTRYNDADGRSVMVPPDLNAGIKEIADAAGIKPEQVFQSWHQGDIQLEGEGEGPVSPLTERDRQEAYLRSEEGKDAVAKNVADAIYDKRGWQGLAFQGNAYGLEGVESYVSTPPLHRRDGETDGQYLARIEESNNPQQQGPWWGKLWGANSKLGHVVYRMDYDDPRNAGLVEEWKGQKAEWMKPGQGESAPDWANRVINQGDLGADAAAMMGRLFYPDGTGVTHHVNPAQNFGWGGHLADPKGELPAVEREMSWDELAQREGKERRIGEGAITAAELATAIIPTVGAMRTPTVGMTLAKTTRHLTGPASRSIARTIGRIPGLSKVGGETGQQVATQVIGKAIPQAAAEGAIEYGITQVVPLAPGENLQPGPIFAMEYGTEVAGQGAGAASAFLPRAGRFGRIIAPIADVLGGTKRVALTDVPGTGWGEIPPAVRRAYQDATFSPDEAAGLARLQDAAELDVTDAQARYILRDSGIDDVARQDSIIADWQAQAQTAPGGIFTTRGVPTVQSGFHVGSDGTVSPVETAAYTPPGRTAPSAVLQYDPALTPEEAVAAAEQASVDLGATPLVSARPDAAGIDPTMTPPKPVEGTLAGAMAAPIGIEIAGATTVETQPAGVESARPLTTAASQGAGAGAATAPVPTAPTLIVPAATATTPDVTKVEVPGSETPSETPPPEVTPAPEGTGTAVEPTPETQVAMSMPMTPTPTQSSVQTAAAPMSSPTPGVGMPSGAPPIPGFPSLGGGRRPFRGGRAVGVNARVIEWTQPTQVTYDLDSDEITEEALGPPREIMVVERDLDAPLPARRHADVMEVLPSDTGVGIEPRIGAKRSRATVLESGAFPGGVVVAGQNPRVISWKQLTRISHDLDTDEVLETALTPPQELRILRSDADAPHNRRRRVDAAEVHATGGYVTVRSRADTKRSKASRPGGRERRGGGGGKRGPRSRMVTTGYGPMPGYGPAAKR